MTTLTCSSRRSASISVSTAFSTVSAPTTASSHPAFSPGSARYSAADATACSLSSPTLTALPYTWSSTHSSAGAVMCADGSRSNRTTARRPSCVNSTNCPPPCPCPYSIARHVSLAQISTTRCASTVVVPPLPSLTCITTSARSG